MIIYLILFVVLLLVTSFINILFHELGHAIPVLIWSKKNVAIFIGSFGDTGQCVNWRMGKLDIWVKYNPFLWRRGLCKQDEVFPVRKVAFQIAMGPILSLILATLSWYILAIYQLQGFIKIFWGLMGLLSTSTVLSSIFPGKIKFSGNGERLYNDTELIVRTLKFGKYRPELQEATTHLQQQNYEDATKLLEKLVGNKYESAFIYRLLIGAHINMKHAERAQQYNDILKEKFRFNGDDHINEGCIHNLNGRHEEAMMCYNKGLEIVPDNIYGLNNLGYSLIMVNRSSEAIPYFDRVIAQDATFFHAFSNRGWAKMKLGQWEEGLEDAQRTLVMKDTYAEAYRSLGIYHLHRLNLKDARTYLEKARLMDADTLFVDEYLKEVSRLERLQPEGDAE
jgi:tetratricopeptide (TPR) repeat protein